MTRIAHPLFAVVALVFSGKVDSAGNDNCVAPIDRDVHFSSAASAGEALLQSKQSQGPKTVLADLASDRSMAPSAGFSKDTTTFFYHIHIPRTGGTTVAALLLADVCSPDEQPEGLGWRQSCTKECAMGLTDNEFACYPGRRWAEHVPFLTSWQRAQNLKAQSGAQHIVYITTLRSGSERVKSQWLYELSHDKWLPPPGVAKISNESLEHWLTLDPGFGREPWNIGNVQVGQLSSAISQNDHVLGKYDLEKAKRTLTTGQWIIGFADCMEQVHEKLSVVARGAHMPKVMPHISQSRPGGVAAEVSRASVVVLSAATQKILDAQTALDNELFSWAWAEANKGIDSRFAKTC